ncbi:Transcriptional activator [Apophysomyces ossiformis]|uniref:Transcriptional activator n=1 Tax=Apophysomyces ossiformis TaxID=679940 RepID=A0A8H7EST8_9FUNG|nr:Transcriptional activator [Apophysomyces ossiformis]
MIIVSVSAVERRKSNVILFNPPVGDAYATPPRRVDGYAFDQLGNNVEELRWRMRKMQSDLLSLQTRIHPFSPEEGSLNVDPNAGRMALTATGQHSLSPQSQQPITWKLSLAPSGLCIDTNIANVNELYRILLNGVSQLNINNDLGISAFSTDSLRGGSNRRRARTWSPSSRPNRSLPLAGTTWQQEHQQQQQQRLWEVDEHEARRIMREQALLADETLPQSTLNDLMQGCYHRCFLPYQMVDKEMAINAEPLLANAMHAWVSKHGCIYHGVGPAQYPAAMGESYFKTARQLLKKCFDMSSATTIHALLNLYMYQLSSERSSLAYMYIGLAIRMAQDLKFHKKAEMPSDIVQQEMNKRLWWSAYWLDLCAALESNRPTMVDDKDCDLDFPTKLDSEDEETGYRISFGVRSIELMRIRKDISKHLPSEQSGQSLLSAISRLENSLTSWLNNLQPEFRFDMNDEFQPTGSFRDEACMILNIQYQTTWIMLHKCFLPTQDKADSPVTLLSLNICTKAANFITKMLDIYASYLNWCQFSYVLDGVIASVTIHELNAVSTEKEVALLAQRNLITTMHVLRKSPLLYMDKVNEIIENIRDSLSAEANSSSPFQDQYRPETMQPNSVASNSTDVDLLSPFANRQLNIGQTSSSVSSESDDVWLGYTDMRMQQPFASSRPYPSSPRTSSKTQVVSQGRFPMATSVTHHPQPEERPMPTDGSMAATTTVIPLPMGLDNRRNEPRDILSTPIDMGGFHHGAELLNANSHLHNPSVFHAMSFPVANDGRIGSLEQPGTFGSLGSALLETTTTKTTTTTIAFQPSSLPSPSVQPQPGASPQTASFDPPCPPVTNIVYSHPYFLMDATSYGAEQQQQQQQQQHQATQQRYSHQTEFSAEPLGLDAFYVDPATASGLLFSNPLLGIEMVPDQDVFRASTTQGTMATPSVTTTTIASATATMTRKRTEREWDGKTD